MLDPDEVETFITSLHLETNKDLVRKLLAGNENWIKGEALLTGQDQRRSELSQNQDPKVAVLTCADSRVSPEYIFNTEIGELFVIRVAGNVLSPEVVASIEFSVDELNSSLLLVLGHENCGAVQAKLQNGDSKLINSNMSSLLNRINTDPKLSVQKNVIKNTKHQIKLLQSQSDLIMQLLESNQIDVLGMYYELESGKVRPLDIKLD